MRALIAAALCILPAAAACVSDDKGEESELPVEDGKDDSFQKPTNHGDIAWDVAAHTVLTDAERHHTWTFELSGDAHVDMTTSYSVLGQRKTDTVLYLYKEGPNGWGSYIARNDDYAGKVYSQLIRDLGAGRYRILVKGYAASTRGKFKVTVGCDGAGCEPAAPPAGTCVFGSTYGEIFENPLLTISNTNKITAATLGTLLPEDQQRLMVAVQQSSHTDVSSPLEAINRVDQGEVNVTWFYEPAARRDFIAFEYGAGDNSYGAIFDRTTGAMSTAIHDGDLLDCALAAETCVLAEDWYQMRNSPELFVHQGTRVITSASQVEGVEADQVLAALQRSEPSITSIAQGLAMVDEDRVNLATYTYTGTNADLTVVEFGRGDTSIGTIYFARSLVIAGVIDDLYISGCALFAPHADGAGLTGDACRATSDCTTGYACRGVFAGEGLCAQIASVPGSGTECDADADCGSAQLICAGYTRGYGQCSPTWMRGSFADAAIVAIPDNAVLTRRLVVRGLATVDTDVALAATIDHPRASQLRVTITNPAGNEVTVHDGVAADDGHPLVLAGPVLNGFSGDESVNGEWVLRVYDRAAGQTGSLQGFTLTVTSRWD